VVDLVSEKAVRKDGFFYGNQQAEDQAGTLGKN